MKVSSEYISCGCNRTPHVLDWNSNGIVLYGTCRSIAVYDPKFSSCAGIVKQALSKHKSRVNSVRWIRNLCREEPATSFISSSTDKCSILWSKVDSTYKPVGNILSHDSIVNIAEGAIIEEDGKSFTYIATATAESNVHIWRKDDDTDSAVEIQKMDLNRGFMLDLKFTHLRKSNVLILACAGEDATITLFAWQRECSKFVECIKLHGHEDWVRGLDFAVADSGDLLLASCSQDHMIRIWRISDDDHIVDDEADEIKLKKTMFSVASKTSENFTYSVALESVLTGHENWVYGIQWHPTLNEGGVRHQPMKLLSSSMDKTMIIWSLDVDSGIWLDEVRVGEVGGNTLGFYGSKFSPDGCTMMAHGYQGAFHIWHQTKDEIWSPGVTVGGHFSEVQDLVWDTDGKFFITSSLDQTTRLHGPWIRSSSDQVTWHEIARPQVHGYDMKCLTLAKDYTLISGADEKVLRAFQAPKLFVENLKSISSIQVDKDLSKLPEGANVPSLGLSNKAVYQQDIANEENSGEKHSKDMYPEIYFRPEALSAPPTEEHLLQNSLWPEIQKLYGHGYELFCVALNHKLGLIASACKASQMEHAAIIIWDIATWQQKHSLKAHKLTITQLAFSPDDNYLLSVSRDRTWALHHCSLESFECVAKSHKESNPHARIIWSCAWTQDSKYFMTVSRDKKLVVWDMDRQSGSFNVKPIHVMKDFEDSVTAVAICNTSLDTKGYLIACGLDNGQISIHSWDPISYEWAVLKIVDDDIGHDLAVKRLQFNPVIESESNMFHLASCGSDFSARLFKIQFVPS